jgi:hypothetical protein
MADARPNPDQRIYRTNGFHTSCSGVYHFSPPCNLTPVNATSGKKTEGEKRGSLIDRAVRTLADHADFANARGQDAITEFQSKSAGSHNVVLKSRTAPGAAIDAHSHGRHLLRIEPAAPHPVVRAAENPNGVLRIARGHQHNIAVAQVSLANLFQAASMCDYRFQRLGDPSQRGT